MTHHEAEEFIDAVILPWEVMAVDDIMRKYRGKTLREALEEYEFETAIQLQLLVYPERTITKEQ